MTTPRPPYDRSVNRRLDSAGGRDARGVGREISPGLIDGTIREGNGGYSRDDLIARDRSPWYDRDYQTSNHDSLVNWTDCGQPRATLWMRQVTLAQQIGTTATRNFDPHPIVGYGSQDQGHGMHTNPAPWKRATNARFHDTAQMVPTHVNRLSPARYTGQSYSQTTRVAGS